MRQKLSQDHIAAVAVLGCGLMLPCHVSAQEAPAAADPPALASPPAVVDPAYGGATVPAPVGMPPAAVPAYGVDYLAPVRYELRPRTGLAIAGGAVFGSVYLASTVVASFIDDKSLAIPVVGPFVEMALLSSSSGSTASSLAPAHFILLMNGLAQSAGVAMLIAGLASKHKVPLYRPRFCISPYTAQAGAGLVASGRF